MEIEWGQDYKIQQMLQQFESALSNGSHGNGDVCAVKLSR